MNPLAALRVDVHAFNPDTLTFYSDTSATWPLALQRIEHNAIVYLPRPIVEPLWWAAAWVPWAACGVLLLILGGLVTWNSRAEEVWMDEEDWSI